jgi:G3E family GTPase
VYSNYPSQPNHTKRTRLVLLDGQDPLKRLQSFELWVEQSFNELESIAVLASGEVFSVPDTAIHSRVFELDQRLQHLKIRLIRLAKGCACCSSRLIVQTHLARLMRLNQPDVLLLELDSQSHVDSVTQWLQSDQWKGWFSTVSVLMVDNK